MTISHFHRRWILSLIGSLLLLGILLPALGDTLPSGRRIVHPAPKPLELRPSETPRPDGDVRLRIVAFNDFHGSFREKNTSIGVAKFVTALTDYCERFEKNRPTAVCVLSGGDNFSGTALSYYSMFETKKRQEKVDCPLEKFFHRIGLVASCIGNHEFDWGPDFLADHLRTSTDRQRRSTYSSGNVVDRRTLEPPGGIPSYELIEIPEVGFKFAILTFTTLETEQKTTVGATAGYLFEKPGEAARRILPQIPEVDAVLFLAHLSSYQDKDGTVTFGRETEDMTDLVRLKPLAIISAHSHRFVSGTVDDVPVLQAGCYANGLALLNFLIDPKTRRIKLESRETVDLRPLRHELRPDPDMETIVARTESLCRFTKVGTVREDMPSDRRKLTDIGVLIGKAVATTFREHTGEEPVLGFQHSGGIRSSFSKGDITEEDCYDMLPFQGGQTLCKLSGDRVFRLVQEGFVNPVGFLQGHGLTFYYENSGVPKQNFVRMTFRHRGEEIPIEPDREYWVVVDSFLVSGGDGYPREIFEDAVVVPLGPQSRDVLIRYCREDLNGDVRIDDEDRLRFVVE